MKLRIASALLALLMLLASLAACKNDENKTDDTSKSNIPVLDNGSSSSSEDKPVDPSSSSSATTEEPVQTTDPVQTEQTTTATTSDTTASTTEAPPAAEIVFTDCNDTVYVTSSALNVRTSPEVKDDNIYTAVTQGTALVRTGYSEKWCRVKIEDKICYVSAGYVTTEDPNIQLDFTTRFEQVYVTADFLNLRTHYSSNAQIHSTVTKGTQLTRVGYHEDWSRVMYDNTVLFCSSKYLSLESPVATTTAATTTATPAAAG